MAGQLYRRVTPLHCQRTSLLCTCIILWALVLPSDSADQLFNDKDSLASQVISIHMSVCKFASLETPCSECFPDDVCLVYQDCCPDRFLNENITYGEQYTRCQPSTPFPINNEGYDRRKMLSRCPRPVNTTQTEGAGQTRSANHLLDQVVTKCEEPDVTDWKQSLPVSSSTTHLVYRNQFCAACHGEVNFTSWETSISCKDTTSKLISMVTTRSEMVQLLMSRAGVDTVKCELKFDPPQNSRQCLPKADKIIDSCNVSGQWRAYDMRLEQACSMYTSIYDNKYKNMFCYICNQRWSVSLEDLMTANALLPPTVVVPGKISYRALLDFSQETVSPQSIIPTSNASCSQNQFLDVDCSCTTPSCTVGKSLTNEGRCESIFTSNFLGYKVCAQVVLETDPPLERIDILMNSIVDNAKELRELRMSVSEWCPRNSRVVFELEAKVSDNEQTKEDFSTLEQLENDVQRLFLRSPTLFSHRDWEIIFFQFTLARPCRGVSNYTFPCPSMPSLQVNGSVYTRYYHSWSWFRMTFPLHNESKVHFIDYETVTPCPFVSVPMANLSLDIDGQRYVYRGTNNSIDMAEVTTVNQSEVWICVSDYQRLTRTNNLTCSSGIAREAIEPTWTVPGLISLVCTCISLLCLLLTLTVYLLLPQLRSGGGKNIIMLIVTLFTAQAVYEFLIEQHENPSFCVAIGIAIHYSWLAALFSMNACTVERYLKLCHPIKSRALFMSKKPFIAATVYTFICPLVIVAVNVTVNLLSRDSVGYGSPRLCYINTMVSRIAAFAVPIGVIVLVNICLLVIIICTVNNDTMEGNSIQSQTRLGLVACVRLSTVTGFTWLLLFGLEAFPHIALEYVIAALFGLQGVLFFFTLVINKWVMSALSKSYPKFGQCVKACSCRQTCCATHPQTPTTSSGTHSTNVAHGKEHNLFDLKKASNV